MPATRHNFVHLKKSGHQTDDLTLSRAPCQANHPLPSAHMLLTSAQTGGLCLDESIISPGYTLPGDLSATARYYDPDVAEPPFVLNPPLRRGWACG